MSDSLRYAQILLVVAACFILGGPVISAAVGRVPRAEQDVRHISPIRTDRGIVGRSVVACPAGDCIVLHYPRRSGRIGDRTLQSLASVREGKLIGETSRRSSSDSFGAETTFNCCTFAVGDVVGLGAGAWIAPNRSGDTNHTLPMQVILDSYFRLLRVYERLDAACEEIEADRELRAGDVLCFVAGRGEEIAFAHAGKVQKRGDRNWLISKLGHGPVVSTRVAATARDFQGHFDQIRIYRREKR